MAQIVDLREKKIDPESMSVHITAGGGLKKGRLRSYGAEKCLKKFPLPTER